MTDFVKNVAELIGLQEAMITREMPAPMTFDTVGPGFDDGVIKSAILCTARSGSSLLSVALEAYGFKFKEYLNSRGLLKKVVTEASVTRCSDLTRAFQDYVVADGRMSIKTPVNGLPYLFMMGEFPKNLTQWRFVYLRRENLVRQAISGFVAQRTGQWTKVMAATGSVQEDDYSFDELMKLVNAASQGNRMLERLIGILGLNSYNIVYEDFLKDQKRILAEISAFLGVDPASYPEADKHEVWLERQSTDLNARWEARFRDDLWKAFRVEMA